MPILRTQVEIIGYNEFKEVALYKALAAEFFGTLMLILASCSAAESGGTWAAAFATGITLATIIQGLGHISGGHANPAVTLSFCLSRQMSVLRGLMYLVVQLVGGIAAAAILYGLVPEIRQSTIGILVKNPLITDAQGFGAEVMTTFALIMAIQGMTDSKKDNLFGAAPLGIGLTVTANILFGGWLSGAGMNPARALGPMVFAQTNIDIWAYHWIYWIGPFLGSALATLTYQLLFKHSPPVTATVSTEQIIGRY